MEIEAFDVKSNLKYAHSVLPEGIYNVKIHKVELRDTRDKTGKYFWLEYVILGPTQQGRLLWDLFNIKNKNLEAEYIGRGQFAQLCKICGINETIQNTNQLIGRSLTVSVMIKVDASWGDKNIIKKRTPLASQGMMIDKSLLDAQVVDENLPF